MEEVVRIDEATCVQVTQHASLLPLIYRSTIAVCVTPTRKTENKVTREEEREQRKEEKERREKRVGERRGEGTRREMRRRRDER